MVGDTAALRGSRRACASAVINSLGTQPQAVHRRRSNQLPALRARHASFLPGARARTDVSRAHSGVPVDDGQPRHRAELRIGDRRDACGARDLSAGSGRGVADGRARRRACARDRDDGGRLEHRRLAGRHVHVLRHAHGVGPDQGLPQAHNRPRRRCGCDCSGSLSDPPDRLVVHRPGFRLDDPDGSSGESAADGPFDRHRRGRRRCAGCALPDQLLARDRGSLLRRQLSHRLLPRGRRSTEGSIGRCHRLPRGQGEASSDCHAGRCRARVLHVSAGEQISRIHRLERTPRSSAALERNRRNDRRACGLLPADCYS